MKDYEKLGGGVKMNMAGIAGVIMIILGVLLLIWSFLAYARHRLTENFGMIWGLTALCLIVAGIVLAATGGSLKALVAVMVLLGIMLVLCLFGFSQVISILIMKNQELAMQVSLLNQENESVLQELMAAKEQKTHE